MTPDIAGDPGTAEAVLFWVLAPIMVLSALGLLFAKKAVHAALLLAVVMISLAVLYIAQNAAFLGVVQIVVYTGAVMMLFLFVLMLVGVSASDSLVETLKGQRIGAGLLGVGLAALLISGLSRVTYGTPVGVDSAENPNALARVVFSDYVFAFEATGALLITAAVGAIMMTHKERLTPKLTQRDRAAMRVAENKHLTPLPAPGVFARHNAVDTPALLPDGTPSELSVSRVLVARGQNRPATGYADDIHAIAPQVGRNRSAAGRRSEIPPAEQDDASMATPVETRDIPDDADERAEREGR